MTIYEFAPARLRKETQNRLSIAVCILVIVLLGVTLWAYWPHGSKTGVQVTIIIAAVALASTFVYRVSSIDRLFSFGLTAAILATLGPFANPIFAASAWTLGVLVGLWALYRKFSLAAGAAFCMWFSALSLVGVWQVTHSALLPLEENADGLLGFVLFLHLPQIVASILTFYLVRTLFATIRSLALTRFNLKQILLRVSWQRVVTMFLAESGVALAVSLLSVGLNTYIFEDENPFGKTSLLLLTSALAFGLAGRWTVRSARERLDSLIDATQQLPWPDDQPVQDLAVKFAQEALPKYRVRAYENIRRTSRDHIRSIPIEGENGVPFTLFAIRRANQPPFRVEDQDILVAIAQIANETVRVRSEANKLKRQANTDRLTGLLNYRGFQDALETLSKMHSPENLVALIFIDVDDFKSINDTHGHEVGNVVLREVAERLRETVAGPCRVARVGGDEFVIVLEHLDSREEAEDLQQKLSAAVTRPIEVDQTRLSLQISQGIAFSTPGQQDLTPLVETADRRMYESRGNLLDAAEEPVRFDPSPEDAPEIVLALRDAILDKRLHLVYQPIIELETQQVIALEALMRYTDPVHGPQPVHRILSEAQRFGLLSQLSSQLLDLCIAAFDSLTARFPELQRMHLNISLQQLLDESFTRHVEELIAARPGIKLVLEVNETSLRESTTETVAEVAKYSRNTAAILAIDDIGQAYTGIASLRDYPFTVWKVDRSIVRKYAHPRSSVIARTLIALGAELGARLIFEGVETEAQHEWLTEIGAEFAQGFVYGRPMSLEEMLLRFETAGSNAWV